MRKYWLSQVAMAVSERVYYAYFILYHHHTPLIMCVSNEVICLKCDFFFLCFFFIISNNVRCMEKVISIFMQISVIYRFNSRLELTHHSFHFYWFWFWFWFWFVGKNLYCYEFGNWNQYFQNNFFFVRSFDWRRGFLSFGIFFFFVLLSFIYSFNA